MLNTAALFPLTSIPPSRTPPHPVASNKSYTHPLPTFHPSPGTRINYSFPYSIPRHPVMSVVLRNGDEVKVNGKIQFNPLLFIIPATHIIPLRSCLLFSSMGSPRFDAIFCGTYNGVPPPRGESETGQFQTAILRSSPFGMVLSPQRRP